VEFAAEMGRPVLTVQELQTATLLKMLVASAMGMAAVAQIAQELQTEAQLKTNVASVEEMGLLALVI